MTKQFAILGPLGSLSQNPPVTSVSLSLTVLEISGCLWWTVCHCPPTQPQHTCCLTDDLPHSPRICCIMTFGVHMHKVVVLFVHYGQCLGLCGTVPKAWPVTSSKLLSTTPQCIYVW